jgi:hypothetical protein
LAAGRGGASNLAQVERFPLSHHSRKPQEYEVAQRIVAVMDVAGRAPFAPQRMREPLCKRFVRFLRLSGAAKPEP